jgi:hypothetical protein
VCTRRCPRTPQKLQAALRPTRGPTPGRLLQPQQVAYREHEEEDEEAARHGLYCGHYRDEEGNAWLMLVTDLLDAVEAAEGVARGVRARDIEHQRVLEREQDGLIDWRRWSRKARGTLADCPRRCGWSRRRRSVC